MSRVVINNLSKRYKDVEALSNVSLTINDGEFYGLLGVNGAGKTTLVNIVSGSLLPTSGSVFIDSYDLSKDISQIKKIVDVSTQETSVALNLTVLENLEFFSNIYDTYDKEYINKIIKSFDLEPYLNKRAKTLSGGYQRRLSIAISLISKPHVLFLDEPTLGLDVIARHELWDTLLSLKGKITIILTTHYLEEIEALCDRVCILSKGKCIESGTINDIIKKANANTFEDAFIKLVKGSNS